MLMNGKKIFDHYYCINSAQTEEIMAYNILQSRHIFIHVKAFILMLVPGGDHLLNTSMCFAWRLVTSISKKSCIKSTHSQELPY